MLLCSPRFKEMWKQKQIQYNQALEKCIENNQNAKKMAIKKKKSIEQSWWNNRDPKAILPTQAFAYISHKFSVIGRLHRQIRNIITTTFPQITAKKEEFGTDWSCLQGLVNPIKMIEI